MGLFKKKITIIYSPVEGEIIDVATVHDEVFASKMMGDGCAFIPNNGDFYSPVKGKVISVFPTKHAITLKADTGIELLIHVGLDTVNLNGEGFNILVKEGQKITPDTQLMQVNLDKLREHHLDTTSMLLFPELDATKTIAISKGKTLVKTEIGKIE